MRYYLIDVTKHDGRVEITEELAKYITGDREPDMLVKIASYCSSVHRWVVDRNAGLVIDGYVKE